MNHLFIGGDGAAHAGPAGGKPSGGHGGKTSGPTIEEVD